VAVLHVSSGRARAVYDRHRSLPIGVAPTAMGGEVLAVRAYAWGEENDFGWRRLPRHIDWWLRGEPGAEPPTVTDVSPVATDLLAVHPETGAVRVLAPAAQFRAMDSFIGRIAVSPDGGAVYLVDRRRKELIGIELD
jgi:hypothetical protein